MITMMNCTCGDNMMTQFNDHATLLVILMSLDDLI